MNIYDIVMAPDPVLKTLSNPVENIDQSIKTQIDRMFATMYDAPGIGLAANQVGLLNRITVMDVDPNSWIYAGEDKNGVLKIESAYRSGEEEADADGSDGEKNHPIAMINPKIVKESEQRSVFDEGCLSLPQQFGTIERPARITVEYIDYDGHKKEIEAEGLLSHCIQHEIDHLDGTLFVDHLSSLKRKMIIRKMEKLKKQMVL